MPTSSHPGAPARPAALFSDRLLQRPLRRLALLGDGSAAVQQTSLGAAAPGPLSVAARYLAADARTGIGGDFYAVQQTPFGLRLLIGDVRGKGPSAGGIAAVLLSAFRRSALRAGTIEQVAARLDRTMERASALRFRADADEDFATALLVEIGPDPASVRLVNCGHVPPLLLDGGRVRTLEPRRPGPPLGLAGVLGAPAGPADPVRLPRGGTLLLLTDGVTEARSPAGDFYDPLSGPALAAPHRGGPGRLLDALCRDLRRHTVGPARDDIAMVAAHRPAQAGDRPPPSVVSTPRRPGR
ncbi:PP2C family protein-serine/threonine phosphatase [Streptacidiphilus carbonis]|uniref:PP2C family protein-serine/threonine phosphatase n=1 Tax=Streptacidiphilus carbonis TaxID=105422 RepID=UPI000694C2D0|nr:PP2C family protein-serine/threonine phosphatase [Streptacidiphilus carbonis]